jgi:DNA-binding CsgD family transcriptional regulator
MEERGSATGERIEGGRWGQDPGRLESAPGDPGPAKDPRSPEAATSRGADGQGSTAKLGVLSWVGWQSALYVFVLGAMCVLLVPLTNLWWLVLVCGTVVPIAHATLDRTRHLPNRSDDRKLKEQELLHAIAERGHLTPTAAAMRTSLTVDEASEMLEGLARKGNLELQVEDDTMTYALRERDRRELPGKLSTPSQAEGDGAPPRPGAQHLDDPLSARELEVLALLATGRTNAEIARDLFVAMGTVKSHTGNIYRKLGAKNRADALARSRELQLLG